MGIFFAASLRMSEEYYLAQRRKGRKDFPVELHPFASCFKLIFKGVINRQWHRQKLKLT
jgi:hypothetical protein